MAADPPLSADDATAPPTAEAAKAARSNYSFSELIFTSLVSSKVFPDGSSCIVYKSL